MHVRKYLAGIATSAVAVSLLALTAAPAMAVYNDDPDDTDGTAVSGMLIGVGSDTSQHAVKLVGDAFNATNPGSKIFSFAATSGGTIPLPSGDQTRPNGSTQGKAALLAGGLADVDFARSSSALSTAEANAGLQMFPFALDTVVTVTSGNVASNAPASLTCANLVAIYSGAVTNWNQLPGGQNGVIAPKLPQSGSGTTKFFTDELKACNGGNAVSLTGTVDTSIQEHDPAGIQNNANAIAPYSQGRAGLAGTAIRVEAGFARDRALYNVVRGGDVTNAAVLDAFGSQGYFCSPAAKPLIEQAGFKQFYPPSKGGVCGAPTKTATSNFVVADVVTATAVTVTSASASSARVVAAVTGSTAPNGTVAFYEGATLLQSGVPLTSGQAVRVQPATPGAHTYRAVFTPAANSPFLTSEGTGTGTVQKASSATTADFAAKAVKGKKVKGSVTVKLTGSTAAATGTVTVKLGNKVVGTGTLSNGTVKLTLKGLKVGKNKLTATWAGDTNANGSSDSFTVKITKPKPKK